MRLHTASTPATSGLQPPGAGSDPTTGTTTTNAAPPVPGQLIIISGKQGRFTAGYCEWNGSWRDCPGHDHLTRADALTCAEQRLRYRS